MFNLILEFIHISTVGNRFDCKVDCMLGADHKQVVSSRHRTQVGLRTQVGHRTQVG